MKNTLIIDYRTAYGVEAISKTSDGTNRLMLIIKSNTSKSPTLKVGSASPVSITESPFEYQVQNSLWTGSSGTLTLTMSDDDGSKEYTITKYNQTIQTGDNLMIISDSDTTYHFANVKGSGGGGGHTYGLGISGTLLSLIENGGSSSVTLPQGDQGYGITAEIEIDNLTYADWESRGTVGSTYTWTGTSTYRGTTRVSDIFMVSGQSTDTKDGYILIFRSLTSSGDLSGVCLGKAVANRGATGAQGQQGPQGETGQTGATGATPNIGMTATVDSNVGTPSVNITKSGTAETPSFALAFSNLKGETGATGQQGPQGETGATGATGNGISNIAKTGTSGLVDTYTITMTSGPSYTFTVTNGEKGDKGDPFTYSDFTPQQLADLKQDISTFYFKAESHYTTTGASESTIPIGITGIRATDILMVDISGLDLIGGVDYTVSGTNIVLTTPITHVGTTVHFIALRCVEVTAQDYSALEGDPGRGITSITKTGTSGLVDTYTILYTDNTTSTFTVTNGQDGSAGGWSAISNKPFSTVNSGSFTVTSDDLRLAGDRVESLSRYSSDGGTSTQGYRGVTANYKTPTGGSGTSNAIVEYVQKHGTTSAATTYTFTNTPTNTNMLIDVYSSIYGEVPTLVETPSTTSVKVTFAESKARTVAIVMR